MKNLDYGIIGNCRTAALISKEGSLDWLCLPDFDSPSVFTKLLDEENGGCFAFGVSEAYTITQTYLGNTNILTTRFEAPEGAFTVFDYMPRYRTNEEKHYMPPEIHRYIRVTRGAPKVRILYDPKINYAREAVKHDVFETYIKTYSVEDSEDKIYMYTSVDFNRVLSGEEFTLTDHQFFVLSYNQKLVTIDNNRVLLDYERTKVYWLNWINRSREYTQYSEMIKRSLLILKLMSYQNSGAMLAAVTTSLPESIGETRNWDYRFCWLRDASMSIDTLLFMKHKNTAARFIGFVKRILKSRDDVFQIMYGIRGERELTEEVLPHLAGYENSRPVRIGNAAYHQVQNDSLGYLLDVIYKYYLYFPGTLDEVEEIWEIVKNMVRMVLRVWQKADQGIWEFRTRELNFVFSKVMSWVAVDRASRIAELLNKDFYAEKWRAQADIIKKDVHEKGWNEEMHCFTQAYENADCDSSLLLMEFYGFIEASDERYVSTVKVIQENLFHNGLMYRYKAEDDFGKPSSAFTICTFWLVEALYVIGEREQAKEIFESLISYSNHVGLYSEDLDFETKRQLGNFPQAYSHLAFINTAVLFSEEKQLSKFIQP
ncbi:MAG TPA: glycoside hydrolase family 15 protein [Porphyromonadaceae bacterium]|nr:glycoside hydrolase family 15 protein [Porphyromonadaceae bacterium]HBX19127.1 glycoside hydrolase family 15 protein [Porphyromonadaceae bacterium]HCM22653.1 glycoside hydrolase family 15 protein [Porphyromonadaceae bacterium]